MSEAVDRPNQPIVRFERVSKTYDGKTLVVRELDLEVERGEFLTLLGPSGSGKTTTLMMLAGFETPTGGDILLEGRSVARLPPHRRGIGMVFQNYALFPHMSVAENLAFPLEVRGVPRTEIRIRVERALAMVRLGGFGDRRPAALSGGQQQRVALARALIFEPTLVLMDEPLGALDKQLREHMQDEIRQLHRALGVTVVYVTHDQSEALTMSDRIAVFHDGRVQQVAAPEDLYHRPANSFVAGFVGESNRLTGRVARLDGRHAFVELDGGEKVFALAGHGLRPGMPALISIRPERLAVEPPPAATNRCAATLREVVFHGDHRRLLLSGFGGLELVARVSGESGPEALEQGASLTVGFAPGDAVALPLEGDLPADGPDALR